MAGNSSNQGERTIRSEKTIGIQETGKKPVVSVIMPAYKCAGFIALALDSVLKQNVPLEILVINDNSPDNLDEVMEKYKQKPQIRYITNETNLGAAAARNKGVALAKGEYIAFLDSDDYWAEGKLKKQIEKIEQTKTVLCCTARELLTPQGNPTGRVIPVKEEITYRELLKGNTINCSSVLLPRAIAGEFPMKHEDSHEDYITWLKILQKYKKACGINEPLLKYRLSNQGKSGNKIKSAGMNYKVYRYLGFGFLRSALYFINYAVHGVLKYAFSYKKW